MKSTMMKNVMEACDEEVAIAVDGVVLDGDLVVPAKAKGIVIFAHGSGSSRKSPRNREVAETIRERGMGTLLFDLLTTEEERLDESTGALRFDIHMLATRLESVTRWLVSQSEWKEMGIGLFGASTGAAAALVAGFLWLMTEADVPPESMAWPMFALCLFSGLTMVTNVPFYSFKDINFRKSVPFIAIFLIVLIFVAVSSDPPKVLFGLFVIYGTSGYGVFFWQWFKGKPVSIVQTSTEPGEGP